MNTQEKRLHFLNIQKKRLHFSNIQEKGYTFWIYRAETCLTVHDIKSLGANTHCVCLEHYYSVDFPWWFDRKISFFSFLCKTAYNMMIGKKNVVKWQKFKTTLCDLTEKLFQLAGLDWDFKSIWKPNLLIILEVKSMHGCSWKKIYCISFYSSFCRASLFHREWLAFINILNFFSKGKSKLVKILTNWGNSQWKGLAMQKIE